MALLTGAEMFDSAVTVLTVSNDDRAEDVIFRWELPLLALGPRAVDNLVLGILENLRVIGRLTEDQRVWITYETGDIKEPAFAAARQVSLAELSVHWDELYSFGLEDPEEEAGWDEEPSRSRWLETPSGWLVDPQRTGG